MEVRKLTEEEIRRLYSLYLLHLSVETDTRKLKPGSLFFALKGPNFNGNKFARKALEAGASYAIVDEEPDEVDERIIYVEDSLKCLQLLARMHRRQFKIPFVAITGSNGKTTTKELVSAVLYTQYKTYTTQGNLNNHIGIPLTLLRVGIDAEMAVIEMGASHQHEIESYCRYAEPNYGLITNIGKAHLEGFGGEEGVKKGKGELFAYLEQHGGTAFVNTYDEKIMDVAKKMTRKVWIGEGENGEVARIIQSDPFLQIAITDRDELKIDTHLVGIYNLPNILAAVTIGKYFKVPDDKIKSAIENYVPSNDRSQMIKKGTNTFIMDAYNANPSSMHAAIENFASMEGKEKVLILGDMKELGTASQQEHENIVKLIDRYHWKDVALAGPEFCAVKHSYQAFSNFSETREWYLRSHFEHTMILVKGSRSMQMEKVVKQN